VDESILLIAIMAHLAALLLFDGALASDTLLICGGLAGWCALVCRQFDRYCCKLLHLLEHGWGLLLAGAIALYGFLFLLIDYPSPIWQRPEDIPIALGIAVFLLVTLLVFLQMILCMVQTHTQIREQEMLRGELNAAREQYQALHDSLDEMRYIRHDVQHQMNLICEMLSAGEYDRLSEYLEGYRRDSAAFSDPPLQYTMQYTVNLLAGYYAHEADKHRIRTDFALNLPEQLPMEDSALASLFGNIWQNALEACTDLPPDADRFIETEAKYDGQRLLICCRNSSPVRQKDTFRQQYLTQRGDGHGYGLLSISHLADVRNGYSHFSFADQVFTTLVMIPLCEAVG
jgi:hypothetical protein